MHYTASACADYARNHGRTKVPYTGYDYLLPGDCSHFAGTAFKQGFAGKNWAMKKQLSPEERARGLKTSPCHNQVFWEFYDGTLPLVYNFADFLVFLLECHQTNEWTSANMPKTPADVKVTIPEVRPGDFAFWWKSDHGRRSYGHAMIIIEVGDKILYSAHSRECIGQDLLASVPAGYDLRIVHVPDVLKECRRPYYYYTQDSTFKVEWRAVHRWICCWHERLGHQEPWVENPTAYACLKWQETRGTTWDSLISSRMNLAGCSSVVVQHEVLSTLQHGGNRTIEIRGSTDDGVTWPYYVGDDSTTFASLQWAANQRNVRLAYIYCGDVQASRYWCVDNVMIWAKPERQHDVSLSEVKQPRGIVSQGTAIRPTTYVWNHGLHADSCLVTVTIGSVYSDTRWVKLDPCAEGLLEFDPWVAQPGTYTAVCFASSDSDECHANDTASMTFQVVADTWVKMFEVYGGGGMKTGACLSASDSNTIFCVTGKYDFFAKYLVRENLWKTRHETPFNTSTGGAIAYAGGNYLFAFRGGQHKTFCRFSISGNAWAIMKDAPEKVGAGGSLAWAGGDYVYAMRGANKRDFWRYRISTNTWHLLVDVPDKVEGGGSLAWTGGDYLYALRGRGSTGFYRYQISTNTWTSMATIPAVVSDGGALAYAPNTNKLYAFCGDNTRYFYCYSIASGTWSSRRQTPAAVRNGGCLTYCDYSVFGGVGAGQNDDFWRYSPPVGGFDGGETEAPADLTRSSGPDEPPEFSGENTLTSGPAEKLTPQYSADGDWIVYAAYDSLRGCMGLYRISANSSGTPEALTTDSTTHENPRSATSGNWLVSAGDSGIYRVTLGATPTVTRLDSGLVADPVLTSDDSCVFYTAWDSTAESRRLYRVRADGTERTCLTPNSAGFSQPQPIAGTNDAVCVILKDEVYQLCRMSGDSLVWLTSDYMNNVNPRISPNGQYVTYEKLDESGYWQVYTMRLSDQYETRVTDGTCPCQTPVYSPSGQYVAYTKWPVDSTGSSEYSQVCYADLAQANSEVALTAADAVRETPAWSPDCQTITYTRTTDAQFGGRKKYKQVVKVKTHIRFSGIEEPAALPLVYALEQNRPNPFTRMTAIRYAVPQASFLDLAVYDVTGRLVKRLVGENQQPGHYTAVWRGEDARGRRVPAGTYYYILRADSKLLRKRMLLVR